jgi:serine protease Do
MDLTPSGGALISDVDPDGPAGRAGLEARDVVIRFDGTAVDDSQELVDLLAGKEPGDEVALVYVRGGRERTTEVSLAGRPEGARPAPMAPTMPRAPQVPSPPIERSGPQIGVVTHPLDEHLAPYFHTKAGSGVLVLRVETDSPAEKAGILPGDVIESFDGEPLADVEELRRAVRRAQPGDDWKAQVIREGKSIEVSGRMERGWQAPMERSIREFRRLRPPDAEDTPSVSQRRYLRRLEREMEKLRERMEELERKLHGADER